VLATLFLVLVLALMVILASGIAVWRAAHADDASRVDHADIVLVLGAAQYGGRPSPVFRGRLEHAALLYRRGFSERILVLGAGRPGDAVSEGEAGARYLEDQGIPPEAVESSPAGSTSFESLEAAAAYMQERGLRSAYLVSDPWHNLRIKRMARDLGIVGHASATFRSAATSHQTRLSGYARETFAYLFYRVFGR
jgi:uncharacterized SAM-binding protein YcdF (DUF218 family)